MDASQRQFLQEWQGIINQATAQVQRILQEAEVGCRQLVAANPADIQPLMNALRAVGLQITDIRVKTGNAWSQHMLARLMTSLDNRQVIDIAERHWSSTEQWIEETWERFRCYHQAEGVRAMWAKARETLGRPVPCSRCGGPVVPQLMFQAESIACRGCNTVNQVTPDPIAATYFGMAPNLWAEQATVEKKLAIERFRRQVDDYLKHQRSLFSSNLDEGEATLLQWEKLERDYWQSYAEASAQIKPSPKTEQDAFVEGKMKMFADRLSQHPAWRKAKGLEAKIEPIAVPPHLMMVDEWGPLHPQQYEEYEYQQFMLEESRADPPRFRELLKKFGYRDQLQYEQVRRTFGRHMGMRALDPQVQAMQLRARKRASDEQMAAKMSKADGVLSPVEGVGVDLYAQLSAKQASGMSTADFQQLLAAHKLDQAKFDRVASVWQERMKNDPDFVVVTAYSKAFSTPMAAVPGAPAAAPAGPAFNPASVTFEKYCEIMGAQAAWSKQGKDVNAMLKQVFGMSAADYSAVSSAMMPKLMTDPNASMRMMTLMQQAEAQYMARG